MFSSSLLYGLDYLNKQYIRDVFNYLDNETQIYNDYINQFPITGPTIISPVSYNIPSNLSPIISRDPINPFGIISTLSPDLNKDKVVRDNITRHFYKKLLSKWLFTDKSVKNLLSYINDNGDGLIKNLSSLKVPNTDTADILKKKISFLEKNIIDPKIIKHILRNIVEKHNINWYHLHKHKELVKRKFIKYFSTIMEELINKSK